MLLDIIRGQQCWSSLWPMVWLFLLQRLWFSKIPWAIMISLRMSPIGSDYLSIHWDSLGRFTRQTLLKEVCPWGKVLCFKSHVSFQLFSLFVCFLLTVENKSSKLPALRTMPSAHYHASLVWHNCLELYCKINTLLYSTFGHCIL